MTTTHQLATARSRIARLGCLQQQLLVVLATGSTTLNRAASGTAADLWTDEDIRTALEMLLVAGIVARIDVAGQQRWELV